MTALPTSPYGDAELELFARLQLRASRGNTLAIKQPDAVQIKDFVRLMKQLPPWQQVLTIEFHLPNLMCDREALRSIYSKSSSRNEDVLGLFLQDSGIPGIDSMTVAWGGTLENRHRTHDGGAAPDLTYLHESGHRMDTVVGSGVEAIRHRNTKSMRSYSSQPFWTNPVRAYVQEHAGASYAGDGPKGKPLYRGARSLMGHLGIAKADGTPFYTPASHASEAMAELLCSYSALYTKYSGHRRAIAQDLNTAYPTLWKPLNQHVIEEAASLAERLYTRRESACRTLITATAVQARKTGEPFDQAESTAMLRLLAIEHGLEPLERMASRCKSTRSRRADAPDAVIELIGRKLEGLCTPNIRAVMGRP